MENRTTIFKDMISRLEALSAESCNCVDMQELFSSLKKVSDVGKILLKDAKDIKSQLKNQFEEQSKKFPNFSNEKAKKDLGIDRTELEEAINRREDEDDFEGIFDVGRRIVEHQYKKKSFFSKERKQMKPTLSALKNNKENFKKCFDALSNGISLIEGKIRIRKVYQGDISVLKEVTNIPILLSKEEKCYIKLNGIELYEDRAVRDTAGGYNGFSFRIAKGISYRVGGFNAKSESHMEKRLIDTGIFYVTSNRYIYDGSSKNIDGDLKKVISVEAYTDGIKISRANKRDEVFTGDMDGEYVGAVISAIVKNLK